MLCNLKHAKEMHIQWNEIKETIVCATYTTQAEISPPLIARFTSLIGSFKKACRQESFSNPDTATLQT